MVAHDDELGTHEGTTTSLEARPAEKLALQWAVEIAASKPLSRALCTTMGRAQAARAIAQASRQTHVDGWFLDHYLWSLANDTSAHVAPDETHRDALENLHLVCQSDAPQQSYGLAVVPCSMHGEAELTRDLLQSAFMRLEIGGTLISAVDNPKDHWLQEQMEALGEKPQIRKHPEGRVYSIEKKRSLKKLKSYECQFAFRDEGRLIHAISRPSVFSHRRIDNGARQLLNAAIVQSGQHVLDIGCGAGIVGLALLARANDVTLHAVDSNPRAVECTAKGAVLNGFSNITTQVASDGSYGEAESFDVAVANPPYYAGFRIAECFVRAAWRGLRPGGVLWLVTKKPNWYQSEMPGSWRRVEIMPSKEYWIVKAERGA